MTIYGLSQSSGVERRLKVEKAGQGLVALTFIDHAAGKERDRVLIQEELLLTAITDPPAEGATVEGTTPPHGEKRLLEVSVHRNEVLLTLQGGPEGNSDVAVGFDDFQDALEGAITRE